jgi:phosphoribosylformylglycinamidine cyclo-ligase
MVEKGITYRDAGVDLEFGNEVSKILYEAAKSTWANRKGKIGEVIVPFDDFSGARAIDIGELPKGTLMNIGFDGIGTKVEVAERVGCHDTVAFDLFEMVCGDAVVRGAEPILVGSILDVKTLTRPDKKPYLDEVRQLAKGYVKAAEAAGVAVVNGEVAELGARISGYSVAPNFLTRFSQAMSYLLSKKTIINPGFHYNWGAGVVWIAKKERMFTGKEIKINDYLIGLKENGFRSNGLSLVRTIGEKKFGREWHNEKFKKNGKTLGELVLEPSVIYTKAVTEMFGGYDREPRAQVNGIAHITGGGIPEKLGRVLKPSGYGAIIDHPLTPPEIMLYFQSIGPVKDTKAYEAWNMGPGMIIVTPKPDDVISVAEKYGIKADVIGQVKKEPGITIKSEGMDSRIRIEYLKFGI